MVDWLNRLKHGYRVFQQRRAAVALIVTLATPMLIAVTGFTVDVGYWYQQQESLQSAADAAALAAAMNNAVAPANNTLVAWRAANSATNSQFNLAAASVQLITTPPANATSPTFTRFTSSVTIPRGSFFSVRGPLFGIGAGFQNASATAVVKTTTVNTLTGGNCIYLTNTTAAGALSDVGGASVNSAGCPIYAASNACDANNATNNAIYATNSGQITAPAVSTPGCVYADTNGGAYIGNSSNSAAGNNSHAASQADPLAALGTPPPWPTMPATPTAPAGTTYVPAPSLSYNTYSGAYGDCVYMGGNYSGNCELYQGAYSALNQPQIKSLVLNEATNSGTTYVSGQLFSHNNSFLTLNGSTYYVNGGVDFEVDNRGLANINASIFNIIGGTALSNGTFNFGVNNANNTYYFSGVTNSSGAATGWGLTVSAPILNVGPGTYYFRGGAMFPGSNPTVNFAQGTYLFSASYSSSGAQNTNSGGVGGGGALNDNNADITFTGGTYYFDGGLNLVGNARITFGPGIYYIRNGDLSFSNGSKITANGVTFVLEGNASYQMDGGTLVQNLTAPSTNCIAPASYPVSTYVLPSSSTQLPNAYAPYDGTGAEGICGVLIYQARGDTTADNIKEGANSNITGVIYAPSASLTVGGGATISSAATNGTAGTLAFIQNTLTLIGKGTLNVNVAANSIVSASGSNSTSSQVLLTN